MELYESVLCIRVSRLARGYCNRISYQALKVGEGRVLRTDKVSSLRLCIQTAQGFLRYAKTGETCI